MAGNRTRPPREAGLRLQQRDVRTTPCARPCRARGVSIRALNALRASQVEPCYAAETLPSARRRGSSTAPLASKSKRTIACGAPEAKRTERKASRSSG